MIGLKRGTLKLLPYDKHWEKEYLSEAARLESNLENNILRIAHIGSTSIPGIRSKPVIDIAMEVADLSQTRKLLEKLEYEYLGDRRSDGDHFFAKGPDENRTHYMHVSTIENSQFDKYIRFRDSLRNNKDLAQKYDQLKTDLMNKHKQDRGRYTAAKSNFINEVIKS